MVMRCFKFFILPVLLLGLLGAPAATDCDERLAACVKANNCAKSPNSAQCKACKAAYDSCAKDQVLRGKKAGGRKV